MTAEARCVHGIENYTGEVVYAAKGAMALSASSAMLRRLKYKVTCRCTSILLAMSIAAIYMSWSDHTCPTYIFT